MNKSCIFCDIVEGKSRETCLEVEKDDHIVFNDIKPASNFHLLAVSKVHFNSVQSLNADHDMLVANMHASLIETIKAKGIEEKDVLFGFHIPPFISVRHLHMHAIAPISSMSFGSRIMFRPDSIWFKTVDSVRKMLKEKSG